MIRPWLYELALAAAAVTIGVLVDALIRAWRNDRLVVLR